MTAQKPDAESAWWQSDAAAKYEKLPITANSPLTGAEWRNEAQLPAGTASLSISCTFGGGKPDETHRMQSADIAVSSAARAR